MKKNLVIIIVFVSWTVDLCTGMERLLPPPLPHSSSSVPYREMQQSFDELLKLNNLPEFYQELLEFSLKTGTKGWEDSSAEEQYVALLFCFYAAKSPLIPFSYDKKIHMPHLKTGISWDKSDITAKIRTVSRLLSLSYCQTKQLVKKREELGKLSGAYVASILKTMREFYNPQLSEQLSLALKTIKENAWQQFNIKWKPLSDQERERNNIYSEKKGMVPILNKEEQRYASWQYEMAQTQRQLRETELRIGLMERRNRTIPNLIESMEKDFLKMLVNYFPGKKGEVITYIRMAGYKNNEINRLVDRTVGRDSKTEFLYKGRSKKDAR